MDPRLAEIYGTNEDVSDVEKTAAAELAEKLAEEGEMNIDEMDNDAIEALAQEVLSSDEEQSDEGEEEEKTASDAEDAEEEAAEEEETEESEEEETDEKAEKTAADETEEKLAEADYIGRVMAHAYVQELKSIDKVAAKKEGPSKTRFRFEQAKQKVKNVASEVGDRAKSTANAAAFEFGRASKKKKGLMGAGAAAGLGAAGFAAKKAFGKKGKKKHSAATPALDTLAQQRALEILEENGVDVSEKQAESEAPSKWDVLGDAVEARAMELLKAEGFEFETDEGTEE